jgi:hypothetical protein
MKRVYIARSLSGPYFPFVGELAKMLASRGFVEADITQTTAPSGDSQLSPYSAILASDLVVALVDRASPNVYLEIGVAIGAGKPVILIADPVAPMPFDLASVPCVSYSRDPTKDLAALDHALSRFDYVSKKLPTRRWSATKELSTFTSDPNRFAAMDSERFEYLVADVLRKKGLEVERVPPHLQSRCDFVGSLWNDRAKIVVEAKKLPAHNRVSIEQVHRLREAATLLGAVAGLLISSSGFTSAAIALAAEKGPQLILLSLNEFLRSKTVSKLLISEATEENPAMNEDDI